MDGLNTRCALTREHRLPEFDRTGRCARLAWEHACRARDEAAEKYPGVTTGHILLGVLQEPSCAGGMLLRKMRVDMDLAIEMTRFVLFYGRRPEETAGPDEWAGVPHTPEALAVLSYALEEADLYHAAYPIGTEHLLLALLRVPRSTGGRMLRYLGVEHEHARATRDAFWELLRLSE